MADKPKPRADIDAYIEALVAAAPPLTPAQISTLSVLLRSHPGGGSDGPDGGATVRP